jgi:catechol 2,3-dioxygenase-like lactoylglutathione lyase family enzyme
MSQMTRVKCVLAVPDLRKSVAYYCNQLGFRLDFEVEGWAFVSRDEFRLMLGGAQTRCPRTRRAITHTSLT